MAHELPPPHPCNYLVLICRPRQVQGLRRHQDKHFERGAAEKDAKVADRKRKQKGWKEEAKRKKKKCGLQGPTFIARLQVVLNGGGERLVDPPLLPEDVALQAPQDGAYLRTRMNKRPFVTIPSTEVGQAFLFMEHLPSALYYSWFSHVTPTARLRASPRLELGLKRGIAQRASHGAWHLRTSREIFAKLNSITCKVLKQAFWGDRLFL